MVLKTISPGCGERASLMLFLAIKSEEGNKATFSHWPRLDTLFATQA